MQAVCVCVRVDSLSDSFGFSVRDFSTVGCIFVEMLRHLMTQFEYSLGMTEPGAGRGWLALLFLGPLSSWLIFIVSAEGSFACAAILSGSC